MISISYTQVSQYLACPAREMYYLQGVKTPKSAPMVYGSIFHKAIASHFSGKPISATQLIKPYLAGDVPSEKGWDDTIEFGPKDWPVDVMMPWIDNAVVLIAQTGTPQAHELFLKRDFADFTLSGMVDGLWNGIIIDFKLAGYSYQVDILQAACYAILSGGPSQFRFYVVHKEKIPRLEIQDVPETQDQKYLDWILKRVIAPTAKAISNNVFPANPSYKWCSKQYCSCWQICKGE